MIDAIDPKITEKPLARCVNCDREVSHYNTYFTPANEEHIVCWRCTQRDEKGFNAKPDFSRQARRGVIPR